MELPKIRKVENIERADTMLKMADEVGIGASYSKAGKWYVVTFTPEHTQQRTWFNLISTMRKKFKSY